MSVAKKHNRLKYGEPQDIVPPHKLYPYPNSCSVSLDGSNAKCYPQWRPRNDSKCGFRMQNRHYVPKRNSDNGWKYGYLEHRLSSFGPKNTWINGMGEAIVYGPKDYLDNSVKQYEWTNDPQMVHNNPQVPEYELQRRDMEGRVPHQLLGSGLKYGECVGEKKYKPMNSSKSGKKEGFGFGYGSGNIDSVNKPEELNYSCGWKPYGYYT